MKGPPIPKDYPSNKESFMVALLIGAAVGFVFGVIFILLMKGG
jgi:hypothetical protein